MGKKIQKQQQHEKLEKNKDHLKQHLQTRQATSMNKTNDENVPLLPQVSYGSVNVSIDDANDFDYCIIFPMEPKEGDVEHATGTMKTPMKDILNRMHRAGLEFKLYYSATKDVIVCEIRANYSRLLIEADRIDIPLLLDANELEKCANNGFPEYNITPFPIVDDTLKYDFHPYQYIHAPYDGAEDLQHFYVKAGPNNTLFTSVQRMKLIESIITSSTGAGLDLDELALNESILACFPLHDNDAKMHLKEHWIPPFAWPWNQPIQAIRNYYGERIALYFAYLGHYTTWLISASFIGILITILQLISNHQSKTINNASGNDEPNMVAGLNMTIIDPVNKYCVPFFGAFMVIWATLFLESWRRQNSLLAMNWGMFDYKLETHIRPQFKGEIIQCPITGKKVKFFHPRQKLFRLLVSWMVLFFLISIVLLLVALIFYLKWYLTLRDPTRFVYFGYRCGSAVAAFANVIQIIIMNKIYYKLFYLMNNYENHATDSAYEASLILKTFVFQFINNFAALFYVAFLKVYVEGECRDHDCLYELKLSLAIVYCSQLFIGNAKEILIPRFWVLVSKHQVLKHSIEDQREQSQAEKEFFLATYDWSGTFDDYTELITQFGFCTLFVVSFPLVPFLSLINNYLEIRVDGFRLIFENRRPRPKSANNIGLWLNILEFVTTLAILSNGWVIVFTSNTLHNVNARGSGGDMDDNQQAIRLRVLILFLTVVFAIRFLFRKCIDSIPRSVMAQLQRQDFFVNKVIYHITDEDDIAQYLREGELEANEPTHGHHFHILESYTVPAKQ